MPKIQVAKNIVISPIAPFLKNVTTSLSNEKEKE
jgi:hypothetical protein